MTSRAPSGSDGERLDVVRVSGASSDEKESPRASNRQLAQTAAGHTAGSQNVCLLACRIDNR
jgi:hypothetical protein